jgi:hypothetical protein
MRFEEQSIVVALAAYAVTDALKGPLSGIFLR